MSRAQDNSSVGASGRKVMMTAEGRCVRTIVGKSPSRLEMGDARREEIALKRNGMAIREETRLIGASKREYR